MTLLLDFLLLFLLLLFVPLLLLPFSPGLLVDFLDSSQFFFKFHSPILEPDFYLSFCETKSMSYLDTPSSRQIMVEMEFFLEFERLKSSVRLSTSSSWATVGTCKNRQDLNEGKLMRDSDTPFTMTARRISLNLKETLTTAISDSRYMFQWNVTCSCTRFTHYNK